MSAICRSLFGAWRGVRRKRQDIAILIPAVSPRGGPSALSDPWLRTGASWRFSGGPGKKSPGRLLLRLRNAGCFPRGFATSIVPRNAGCFPRASERSESGSNLIVPLRRNARSAGMRGYSSRKRPNQGVSGKPRGRGISVWVRRRGIRSPGAESCTGRSAAGDDSWPCRSIGTRGRSCSKTDTFSSRRRMTKAVRRPGKNGESGLGSGRNANNRRAYGETSEVRARRGGSGLGYCANRGRDELP